MTWRYYGGVSIQLVMRGLDVLEVIEVVRLDVPSILIS
jgi:hypothetical protein